MKCALSAFAVLSFAACGPGAEPSTGPLAHVVSASGKYALDVYTTPQPPVRGKIDARLNVRQQDGSVALGLRPVLTPWMPQHGHGSSVTPSVVETEDGNYEVNDLYLPMEGLWQLRTVVDDSPGDELDASIEVR